MLKLSLTHINHIMTSIAAGLNFPDHSSESKCTCVLKLDLVMLLVLALTKVVHFAACVPVGKTEAESDSSR